MKELKVTPPEGYIIDEEKSTIYNIVFKKKNKLPVTWEEYCKQYYDSKLEFYITNCSRIDQTSPDKGPRRELEDKNLLSAKKDAEAHLALIQLHRLRDVYRQGWKPDWSNYDETKYCIYGWSNTIDIDIFSSDHCILAFKTEELRDEFLKNFKDLIEKAKYLI